MAFRQAEGLSVFTESFFVPRTVLVAFESDVTRFRLSSELRKSGYQVLEVRDGLELMHYLEQALRPLVPFPVPDAIVADAQLWGYSGAEVCWTLRECDVEIPFVLVRRAGLALDEQEREICESGASYVANSPINPVALTEVLARLCAH